MKLLFMLFFAVLPLYATFSQSAVPSASSEPRIITNEHLRKFLLATTWSWQRPGGPKEKLEFFADGTARHSAFVAKFQIKNPKEVELRIGKDKARLTFNDTYSRYNGIDFNGSRPVEGERQGDR